MNEVIAQLNHPLPYVLLLVITALVSVANHFFRVERHASPADVFVAASLVGLAILTARGG